MEPSKEEIRILLRYEFQLRHDARTAAENVNRAKGQQVVGLSTAKKWFKRFRDEGIENLSDKPRSGRPREIDPKAVIDAIELDASLTTEDLADEFGCSKMQISRILKEAGKKWKKAKWVPHELKASQMRKRKEIAQKLLRRNRRTPFLANVVTIDEKWIFFKSQRRGNQWLSAGQQGTPIPRPNQHAPKAMLIIFWDRTGPVHWDLLPAGQTINAERYCEHLDRCNQAIPRRRRRNIILLQDNARPHIARLTQSKLRELGWEWLDHPPYSPDLSPSDYHLFRSLEHFLSKRKFRNINQLRQGLVSFFDSKGVEFWRQGIDLLPERWEKVVQNGGAYFE